MLLITLIAAGIEQAAAGMSRTSPNCKNICTNYKRTKLLATQQTEFRSLGGLPPRFAELLIPAKGQLHKHESRAAAPSAVNANTTPPY
jgi:hypothetical protein